MTLSLFFGCMIIGETEDLSKLKNCFAIDKYAVSFNKVKEQLEPIDVMIELKYIKFMLCFGLFAESFKLLKYFPDNRIGLIGSIIFGIVMSRLVLCPAFSSLTEFMVLFFTRHPIKPQKDLLLDSLEREYFVPDVNK